MNKAFRLVRNMVRRGHRPGLRTVGLVVAACGAPMAYAGDYTVATPVELGMAINAANSDGTSNTNITLTQDITVSIGGVFDASINPVALTLDTSGFVLRFQGALASVTGTGSYTYIDFFGMPGSSTLAVADGAVLQTVGDMFFSSGGFDIHGNGSVLVVAKDLVLGRGDDVTFTLSNGAKLSTGRSFVGEVPGSTAATTITATVDGAGTEWNAGSFLAIGGASDSVAVTVSNGGSIRLSSPGAVGAIGRGGSGSLLVTGAGSRLLLDSGKLEIGTKFVTTSGAGTLSIRDGGLVAAPSVQMAVADSATTGTLVVDTGGTLETATLSRQLGTASVTFDNGILRASAASTTVAPLISRFVPGSFQLASGGMRLDSNGFDVTVASVLSGPGGLTKEGAGTVTLSGNNVYAGTTSVTQGRVLAGLANAFSPASTHTVAPGATLDTGGLNQVVAGLDNGGTVSLFGNALGSTLRTTGNYVGRNGLLQIGTVLAGSSSVSDRLVVDGLGVSASGTTTVQVTNLGGLGALTSGDGIEVVSGINGATTTAQTTKSAFSLATGHIDAGAYEYRLHAADASGAGENWYLRSTRVLPPTSPPTTPPASPAPQVLPTYRVEVPLFTALPEQLREASLAMLGNLHQRVGDDVVRSSGGDPAVAPPRHAWGRLISVDRSIRQGGDTNPSSEGRLHGFQAGTDLWAGGHWRAGVYVGQLDGAMRTRGFASGVYGTAVGSNDLRSQSLGIYATYANDDGFYADTVLQAGRHRYGVRPFTAAATDGHTGHSRMASIEVGQSWPFASGWRLEPQLQLVHQSLDLRDTSIAGALVQQDSHGGWMARAGVRVKGEVSTGAGSAQPYARLNLLRSSRGWDITRFIGPAGTTGLATRTGGTRGELAAGATLQLGSGMSVYGELGKLWALGGGARTHSSIQGSLGLLVHW